MVTIAEDDGSATGLRWHRSDDSVQHRVNHHAQSFDQEIACRMLDYLGRLHRRRSRLCQTTTQALQRLNTRTNSSASDSCTATSSPEQRAIATALSDVDALLGGLDRLIAKKRDLKQAAMQQLLTGQTRLPGFHGEWEVKQLGEMSIAAAESASLDQHRRSIGTRRLSLGSRPSRHSLRRSISIHKLNIPHQRTSTDSQLDDVNSDLLLLPSDTGTSKHCRCE